MKEIRLCHTEKETIEYAAQIAQSLKGGEIFALAGPLGCGKTTFVKGLALGMQIHQTVTSPTFNLVHRYGGGRLALIHYDLYRLKKIQELEATDLETEMGQNHVIAIEWPQLAEPLLPSERTRHVEFQETARQEWQLTLAFNN